MLLRLVEEGFDIDRILYFNLGWEFPQMERHVARVEEFIDQEIETIKPDNPVEYYLLEYKIRASRGPNKGKVHRIGKGWPHPSRRWCTELKMRTLYAQHGRNDVVNSGIAIDESHRAKGIRARETRAWVVFPLIAWGMTEDDCLEYCYKRGFKWEGLYYKFNRVSCYCCPLQPRYNLERLRRQFPALWEHMLELDKQIQDNKGFRRGKTVQEWDEHLSWKYGD